MKRKYIWSFVLVLLVLLGTLALYLYPKFHQALELPDCSLVSRITVYAHMVKNTVAVIEDKKRISEICNFFERRRNDWEPLFDTPSVNSIRVVIAETKGRIYVIDVGYNAMIAQSKVEPITRGIDKKEIDQLFILLGTSPALCGLKPPE